MKPKLLEHMAWALLVFALSYLPLWHQLSTPAIYIWDEASYALNALEMSFDHDFWVLKADGQPSLYNVKPPLVIWLQCLSIWAFGPGEFAVRFPSALAGLLTCLAVFFFAKRNFNALTALSAVLFLVTTEGYVRHHMTRSGDLDSVLVFFVTAYALLLFDWLLNDLPAPAQRRRIGWMGFLVFCAFMSKSVAGLMPLLGLSLGALAIGKGRLVFADRQVYVTAVLVLLGCLGYYALRGMAQPGYLEKVWHSEYVRFTENIMPWLEAPWYYYLVTLKNKLYPIYCWALPFSLLLLRTANTRISTFYLLATIYCASLVLLLSYPSVKLDWYIAPIYPVLSLVLACLLHEINLALGLMRIKLLRRKPQDAPPPTKLQAAKSSGGNWLSIALMVLVFAVPYCRAVQRTGEVDIREPQEREAHALRELGSTRPDLRSYKLFMPVEYPEHADAARFYVHILNRRHTSNGRVSLIGDINQIQLGDTVLCSSHAGRHGLAEQFKLDTLLALRHGALYRMGVK